MADGIAQTKDGPFKTHDNGDGTFSETNAATLTTLLAGEDLSANVIKTEERFSYLTINTAATTVIKGSAGFIHAITIVGGTAGAITVYDNTSGSGTTIIPTFTPGAVSVPVTIILDEVFGTGLTIVTAAATILNVSYR